MISADATCLNQWGERILKVFHGQQTIGSFHETGTDLCIFGRGTDDAEHARR